MDPKNKHRVDSIADKNYKVIKTRADATAYLSELLRVNMDNELKSVEAEVLAQFKNLETM